MTVTKFLYLCVMILPIERVWKQVEFIHIPSSVMECKHNIERVWKQARILSHTP